MVMGEEREREEEEEKKIWKQEEVWRRKERMTDLYPFNFTRDWKGRIHVKALPLCKYFIYYYYYFLSFGCVREKVFQSYTKILAKPF